MNISQAGRLTIPCLLPWYRQWWQLQVSNALGVGGGRRQGGNRGAGGSPGGVGGKPGTGEWRGFLPFSHPGPCWTEA